MRPAHNTPVGYDRNDCWLTCGERDDKCSALGIEDGDPFSEIERLRDMIDNRNEFIAEHGLWPQLGEYLSKQESDASH